MKWLLLTLFNFLESGCFMISAFTLRSEMLWIKISTWPTSTQKSLPSFPEPLVDTGFQITLKYFQLIILLLLYNIE